MFLIRSNVSFNNSSVKVTLALANRLVELLGVAGTFQHLTSG